MQLISPDVSITIIHLGKLMSKISLPPGPPLSHLARNEKFLALEIFLSQNAQRLFKGILREGDINNKATQAQGQVDAASKRRGPNFHPRLKSHIQS